MMASAVKPATVRIFIYFINKKAVMAIAVERHSQYFQGCGAMASIIDEGKY